MTSQPRTLSLQLSPDPASAYDGACWPGNRDLEEQLDALVAQWPPERAGISRVLYSPPDWDGHPRTVAVGSGRMKTGSFPHDDTHTLDLKLSGGAVCRVLVIPPATAEATARDVLDSVSSGAGWSRERLLEAVAPA